MNEYLKQSREVRKWPYAPVRQGHPGGRHVPASGSRGPQARGRFRKGGRYGWKPSSSSNFSIRAFRAYPPIEIRQTVPCRAIRGNSISVNRTLPPLLRFPWSFGLTPGTSGFQTAFFKDEFRKSKIKLRELQYLKRFVMISAVTFECKRGPMVWSTGSAMW